jgi:hypothetical protein
MQQSKDVRHIVSQTFCEVLGLPQIDADVAFSDLGGVSLEAAQIASQLTTALGINLSAGEILGRESLLDVMRLVSERMPKELPQPVNSSG